jgi:hypothetical protein
MPVSSGEESPPQAARRKRKQLLIKVPRSRLLVIVIGLSEMSLLVLDRGAARHHRGRPLNDGFGLPSIDRVESRLFRGPRSPRRPPASGLGCGNFFKAVPNPGDLPEFYRSRLNG